MAIGNRQIGWSQESNLLWNISAQIQKLISVISKSLAPKYKVYTALLTQSGGNDPQSIYEGELTIGVTYFINESAILDGCDFTNVGAPNNNQGTYFVATGTTPNWGTTTNPDMLTYNTGAPIVTVLENTIGNIWFTYGAVGQYFLYSENAFITGKTWNTKCLDFGVNGSTIRALLNNNEDLNTMSLWSESDYDTASNDILYNTPIEIRVYN